MLLQLTITAKLIYTGGNQPFYLQSFQKHKNMHVERVTKKEKEKEKKDEDIYSHASCKQ